MNVRRNVRRNVALKKILFSAVFAAQLIAGPLHADEVDEQAVKELVQQEVKRLLNADGALDAAIEEGIKRIVRKQRAAAAQERVEAQQAQVENLRPVDARRDHILGNPDAPVTLVEYSDFECPFCKRFHPTAIRLLEDNPDEIRWVYRHFPLGMHNPGAQKQAEASECVAELKGNDAFWEYVHAIYDRTRAGGRGFPLDNLRPLAEEFGVDGDSFEACLDGGKMTARVIQDHEDGLRVGISGTPAGFLMNRRGEVRFIVGALPIGELQALVDDLR